MAIFKKKKEEITEQEVKSPKEVEDYYSEIDTLQDELLTERELNNDFQDFLGERKSMLPYTKEKRELIEARIKLEVLKIFKKKKMETERGGAEDGWFKYKDYFDIPEISENFNIFTANGDRNMGKSVSSGEETDKIVEKGEKFMIWRNIDDEIEAQVSSDLQENGWLYKRGYKHLSGKAKAPNIFKVSREMDPKTRKFKEVKQLVGWYRPLNTSAKTKSINFPDTGIIIYEEFNEVNIPHKFLKFVKMASTVIRHKPDVKIILQANYVDQSDDMLQSLGLGGKTLTKEDFVVFNWELGAIILNIPKGIYRVASNKKKDTAYRASLGNYDVWKSQHGGGFSNEEPVNIINEKEFSSVKPMFNIYHKNVTSRANKGYGAYKITMYDVYDNAGGRHNVITKTVGSNDKPIFIFDHLNKIMYPEAIMLELDVLDELIALWNSNQLKTTSYEVHGIIVSLFAAASKVLEKENEYISEIEEI